jgi:hypothetical protein
MQVPRHRRKHRVVSDLSGPLLTTKLYLPPLPPGYLARPRLVAQLEVGLCLRRKERG